MKTIQDSNKKILLDIQRELCANVSKDKLHKFKKEIDSIYYNDLYIEDVSLRFELRDQIVRRLSI